MYQKLILFDDEIEALKCTGWKYEILFAEEKKGIFVVNTDVPDSMI